MHEKLKLILSKETSKIELTNKQSNHVYKTKGEYICDYQGDLFLKFNNETAWYWNKDIDIEIKLNSNRKIDINNYGDANILMEFEDNINKIYIKNLKNNHNISFHVNDNENVEWKFNVKYNNSINFSMCFKYDYKNILNNVIDELNLMNVQVNNKNCDINKLQDINNENNIKIVKLKKDINKLELELNDKQNINSFTNSCTDTYYYLDKIPNNLHKPINFHTRPSNFNNTSTNFYNTVTDTTCHHRKSNIFDDFYNEFD